MRPDAALVLLSCPVLCVTGCRQLLQAVNCRVPTFGDDASFVAKYVRSAVAVIREYRYHRQHDRHHHRRPTVCRQGL